MHSFAEYVNKQANYARMSDMDVEDCQPSITVRADVIFTLRYLLAQIKQELAITMKASHKNEPIRHRIKEAISGKSHVLFVSCVDKIQHQHFKKLPGAAQYILGLLQTSADFSEKTYAYLQHFAKKYATFVAHVLGVAAKRADVTTIGPDILFVILEKDMKMPTAMAKALKYPFNKVKASDNDASVECVTIGELIDL